MSCNGGEIAKIAGLTVLAETILFGVCLCCYYSSVWLKRILCCFI